MQEELDMLREVGNIASGHGSSALSDMLGKRINLKFPSVEVITPDQVNSRLPAVKLTLAVFSNIPLSIEGKVAFLMDGENAVRLINMSSKTENPEESKPALILDMMGLSLLKEIGDIAVGAYVNALSMVLKQVTTGVRSTLISGSAEDILNTVILFKEKEKYCYLIESVFEEPKSGLSGGFYLVLTPGAVMSVMDTCKKMLGDSGK